MSAITMGTSAIKVFVLQVKDREMRVCDYNTLRELRIHTREAGTFCAGDRIHVEYSGDEMMRAFPRIRENQIYRITRF